MNNGPVLIVDEQFLEKVLHPAVFDHLPDCGEVLLIYHVLHRVSAIQPASGGAKAAVKPLGLVRLQRAELHQTFGSDQSVLVYAFVIYLLDLPADQVEHLICPATVHVLYGDLQVGLLHNILYIGSHLFCKAG